jgi:hypothetical protein
MDKLEDKIISLYTQNTPFNFSRHPMNLISDIFSRGNFEMPASWPTPTNILQINIGDHLSRRVDAKQEVMYRVNFILYYYELIGPDEI